MSKVQPAIPIMTTRHRRSSRNQSNSETGLIHLELRSGLTRIRSATATGSERQSLGLAWLVLKAFY